MKIKMKMKMIGRIIRNRAIHFLYGLTKVSPDSYIMRGSFFSSDFQMGKHGFIARNANICSNTIFGDYVMVGPGLSVVGSDHVYDQLGIPVIFSGRPSQKQTILGDDVWIASGVTILAGVQIGSGAIISSCAVVTKDVPPFAIVRGIPGEVAGYRFDDSDFGKHLELIRQGNPGWQYCEPR